MIEIRVSREEDRDKLLACADEAFGDSLPKGGFAALLPKLYGPGAQVGGSHLLAEEEGQILGLVLAEPMEYRVLEERLKIAGVGTVSVAKQARGRGIMKLLMKETISRLKKEGYAFAFLGGQRQRYAYWGFQACGTQMYFSWNQANLKHSLPVAKEDRIRLVPMAPDSEQCKEAWQLWNREPVRVERAEEAFYDILCSWQGKPYACYKQGRFAGYMVLLLEEEKESGRILELVLKEGVQAPSVLHALADCLGIRQGSIRVDYPKQELLRQLEGFCEEERLECGHKFLILDWCAVFKAMLSIKQRSTPLRDGEAVLAITEADGKKIVLRICIQEGRISVTEEGTVPRPAKQEAAKEGTMPRPAAEQAVKQAAVQLELTAQRAAGILFRESLISYEELKKLPAGWFPLPLYVNEQDCC